MRVRGDRRFGPPWLDLPIAAILSRDRLAGLGRDLPGSDRRAANQAVGNHAGEAVDAVAAAGMRRAESSPAA